MHNQLFFGTASGTAVLPWQYRVQVPKGDAFRAGGNNIDALVAVVNKGGAKGERAIPVRGPSVAVVGTGEGKEARQSWPGG